MSHVRTVVTEPEKREPVMLRGEFRRGFFVLEGPLTRLEREALMRYRTWSWWQRQWWRIRFRWARLRGKDT